MRLKRILCLLLSLLTLGSALPYTFAAEPASEPVPEASAAADSEAEEPSEPEAEEPVEPETEEPVEPEAEEPVEPETEEPSEPETAEPVEPEAEEPVEPETAEPVEPETAEPSEPETAEPGEPEDDETEQLPAILRLGNTSEMMLSGGGRMVQTDGWLYFLGEANDHIYRTDGETTECIVDAPACCLNYIDGALIYAVRGEGSFSAYRCDPETGEIAALLQDVSGLLRQLYAASDGALYYLADETVWRLPPDGEPAALRDVPGAVSFVPTGFGMFYACGSLFALDVWLDDTMLAGSVEEYYILNEDDDPRLIFCQDGDNYQISLRALFLGDGAIRDYTGLGEIDAEELFAGETPLTEAAPAVSVEPQVPATRALRAASEQTRSITQGMINIALRAYQMTDISWTPVRTVSGWKGQLRYDKGVTYTGLPYGQPTDKYYVPWSASLSQFLEAVSSESSAFYTERSAEMGDGLPYATDCSGFVSWAWQTAGRLHTAGLAEESVATLVSSSDYASAQIGDCINDVNTHALLITNVRYDSDGAITAIEVAHANVSQNTNYCCARIWYGSGYSYSLADLQSKYFAQGYSLYRYKSRNSVSFTEDPNVPVSHDAKPTATSASQPKLHYGIDVSQWQGAIRWSKTSKYTEFAIIRSQYGADYLDTEFERNVTNCMRYKVPFGVYVYGLATTPAQAAAEAQVCLGLLRGRKTDLPIFYDVEDEKNLSLPNDQLFRVVQAFCSAIESAGYRAGVYCSTHFWETKLSDSRYAKWTRWVAEWNSSYSCDYRQGLNVFQYNNTANIQGIVDEQGVPLDVDLDLWVGDLGDDSRMYVITQTKPTCTNSGKNVYRSTDGKITWAVKLPALGHDFVNGVCTRCGAQNPGSSYVVNFRDVKKSAWYYSAVKYVVQHGLFNGMSETEFAPNGTMTRAMLVTVLWRMAGKPHTVAYMPFTDVPLGKYYTEPIMWAYQKNIVSGMTPTEFWPELSITREQLATILYRYSGQKQTSTDALDSFVDKGTVSGYAKLAMAWAVSNGLIQGMPNKMLDPGGTATRAQVATVIKRYLSGSQGSSPGIAIGF